MLSPRLRAAAHPERLHKCAQATLRRRKCLSPRYNEKRVDGYRVSSYGCGSIVSQTELSNSARLLTRRFFIQQSGATRPRFVEWRRGRDSNPRYAFGVHTLSRRAPSTTRTPLQIVPVKTHRTPMRLRCRCYRLSPPAPLIRVPLARPQFLPSERRHRTRARSGETLLPNYDCPSHNRQCSYGPDQDSPPSTAADRAAH